MAPVSGPSGSIVTRARGVCGGRAGWRCEPRSENLMESGSGPDDTDAAFEAALTAYAARDLALAKLRCQAILSANPDHPEALNLLGVVLQDLGLAAESVPFIARAIEIDPAFPDAFANLARGFRLLGDNARAVTAARQATSLDSELAEAWLQLGFALSALDRHTDALVALREAAA